jgi:HK97 family phage major capsid protein
MSNRIKELREKQAKIVAEARERNDLIQANTDEGRTKELEAQHDAAMAEYDRLEKVIEREEKLEGLEKRAEDLRAKNRPTPRDGIARGVDEGEKPDYRGAFYRMIAAGGDLSELSAEDRAVLRGGVPKDAELRVQSIGTTTAGGFTVPVELANQIIKSMALWGPMYDDDVCTVIRTASGNQINIPTVNDTSVVVVQHAEGTALTDDNSADATFGQRRLDAWVYDTKFIRFSMELAQDSIFNMEQLLGELLGERLGRRANTELTTGDGTGDPNGIVTASTLGVTAAAVAAITSDELINLVHSVNPAYRMSPKVRFMFNDTTLSAIRRLKDGQGQYLWQLGDYTNGIAPTLLGYPFSVNQAMTSPATAVRSVVFGDFGKYWVRKVGDPVIGIMRERFWPDLGIAGVIRLDGELADTAAVRHLIQA